MQQLNAVIFDMDGVLIDSEPFWEEAGNEVLQEFGVTLTHEQHVATTGLRTREWLDLWFTYYKIDKSFAEEAEKNIEAKVISKIRTQGKSMPGVDHIFKFFEERSFIIGLATSSPVSFIEVVTEKLQIKNKLRAFSSSEDLPFSKPHPLVYLNCAEKLGVSPLQCVCFEDSFNGMISAKAARMKCIVVPPIDHHNLSKWGAADLKIKSLLDFDEHKLAGLSPTI